MGSRESKEKPQPSSPPERGRPRAGVLSPPPEPLFSLPPAEKEKKQPPRSASKPSIPIDVYVVVIQSAIRAYYERKQFVLKKKSAIQLQSFFRGHRQKLRFRKQRRCSIKIQAYIRGWIARRLFKAIEKRTYVARELLATEQSYQQFLRVALRVYRDPLLESGILSKRKLDVLFHEVDHIVQCCESFCSALEKRMRTWNAWATLGDLIASECEKWMGPYLSYANNFNNAAALLQRALERKPKFKQFCDKCLEVPELQGLDLPALLIMPVQRLGQYQLLLADLRKATPPTHADAPLLDKATRRIRELGEVVNESKRHTEDHKRVVDIYARLIPRLKYPEPYRRFISEGTLKEIGAEAPKELHYFLFSDQLLITKEPRKKKRIQAEERLKLKFNVPLRELVVADPLESHAPPSHVILMQPTAAAAAPSSASVMSLVNPLRVALNTPEMKKRFVEKVRSLQMAMSAPGTGCGAPVSAVGHAMALIRNNAQSPAISSPQM